MFFLIFSNDFQTVQFIDHCGQQTNIQNKYKKWKKKKIQCSTTGRYICCYIKCFGSDRYKDGNRNISRGEVAFYPSTFSSSPISCNCYYIYPAVGILLAHLIGSDIWRVSFVCKSKNFVATHPLIPPWWKATAIICGPSEGDGRSNWIGLLNQPMTDQE